MEKMKMQTQNKADDNFRKLAELFPNAVTEIINVDGNVVRAIDKEVLMQEISCKVVEGNEERYQFNWPDKKKSIQLANAPINKTLRPCREDSVDFDNTENLYIEGDNLEVLKLLQETYLGKIKLIYIDPPYNTGSDLIYEDDFSQKTNEYIKNSGQFDDEGNRLVQNTDSNGRFHTDWLNMMYPRLKLAKDLLSDDGVIFISIDDNENSNLKKICDEIFGETNFVSNIGLEITKTQGMKVKAAKEGSIVKNYEYILCYAKNNPSKRVVKNVLYDINSAYDNHFSIYFDLNSLERKSVIEFFNEEKEIKKEFERFNYDINMQNIEKLLSVSERFRDLLYKKYSDNIFQEMACNITVSNDIDNQLNQGKIIKYNNYILKKTQGNKLRQFGALKDTINTADDYYNTYGRVTIRGNLWKGFYSDMMNVAKEGNTDFPNGKKPIRLIKQITKWIGLVDNDIILDFFSGSATTAHAVMQLNAEDGGHRKFIMVQLPEKTKEDSEAYKAGYKNICEIGKERIRRAGKKIKEEAGMFGDNLDIGFRVLKCDSSNMKDVYYNPSEYDEDLISKLEGNIKEDRTAEDLLFQVMLDLGVLLSSKIEQSTIAGKKVFSVEDNYLIACFDDNVNEEVIKEIAQKKPYYFVMRDSSLENDSVSTNFEQIFNAYSPETIRKVI